MVKAALAVFSLIGFMAMMTGFIVDAPQAISIMEKSYFSPHIQTVVTFVQYAFREHFILLLLLMPIVMGFFWMINTNHVDRLRAEFDKRRKVAKVSRKQRKK